MNELKKIDFQQGWFMANGKKYIIESGFSIERYAFYQKYQIELGYNCTFDKMFQEWERVVMLANKLQFSDIVIIAYNMSRAIAKLDEKEPAVLKLCALFVNEENEDRRTITEDMITAKIRDWQEEGIDVGDFFTLASNTITGFITAYKKVSQSISQAEGV
jgi:hypothetical protein